MSYPQSPLSAGQAGRIKGGERLPYVAGSGNFAALQKPGLQLHVYGEPPVEVNAWCKQHEEVSLNVFPFNEGARQAGLAENAAYLLRPDGYVGVAQREFDGDALDAVLWGRWHWQF